MSSLWLLCPGWRSSDGMPGPAHRMDGAEQRILEEEGMMSSWQNMAKEEKVRNLGIFAEKTEEAFLQVLMGCHSCNFAMSHTRAWWGSPHGVIGINSCEGNVPHALALWKLAKHRGGYAGYLISLWMHIMGIFDKQGKKHLSGITQVIGHSCPVRAGRVKIKRYGCYYFYMLYFFLKGFSPPSSSKAFFYSSEI